MHNLNLDRESRALSFSGRSITFICGGETSGMRCQGTCRCDARHEHICLSSPPPVVPRCRRWRTVQRTLCDSWVPTAIMSVLLRVLPVLPIFRLIMRVATLLLPCRGGLVLRVVLDTWLLGRVIRYVGFATVNFVWTRRDSDWLLGWYPKVSRLQYLKFKVEKSVTCGELATAHCLDSIGTTTTHKTLANCRTHGSTRQHRYRTNDPNTAVRLRDAPPRSHSCSILRISLVHQLCRSFPPSSLETSYLDPEVPIGRQCQSH